MSQHTFTIPIAPAQASIISEHWADHGIRGGSMIAQPWVEDNNFTAIMFAILNPAESRHIDEVLKPAPVEPAAKKSMEDALTVIGLLIDTAVVALNNGGPHSVLVALEQMHDRVAEARQLAEKAVEAADMEPATTKEELKANQ